MEKIIAITNQKGGVGKTTTSLNLSAALGQLKQKVLIIDADAQGNCTTGAGISKEDIVHSMYEVISNDCKMEDIIIKDIFTNVDLAPATISLAGAEIYFLEKRDKSEQILKKALKPILQNYDYIIIDCPPSLGLMNRNILACASSVLIPLQVEFYALEGLAQLLSSISLVKRLNNSRLTIEGILLTMYDSRTNLSEEVRQEAKKYFPEKVYKTFIPRNVKLSEAPSYGESILTYDKKGAGAKAYSKLAREVLKNNG